MKFLEVLKGSYLQQTAAYWLSPKKMPILIFGALILRLLGFLSDGHNHDFEHFWHWASRLAECGITDIYSEPGSRFYCDYPPLYLYFLWGAGKLFNALDLNIFSNAFSLTLKGVNLLIEGAFLFAFWKLTKHKMWFFLLLLNPVVIFNAYFWGQVDVIFGALLVMAVITLIQNRFIWSAVLAGLALSMKSQMLLFIPLFGVIFLLKLGRGNPLVKVVAIAAGIAAFVLPSLPFFFAGNLLESFEPHYTASGRYPYIAMNAFNVWWALFADFSLKADLQFPSSATILFGSYTLKHLAFTLFAPVYGVLLVLCWRFRRSLSPEFILKMFALLSISYFMLLPEMHERYSFPFFMFAPAIVLIFNREWLFYVAFTAIHVYNLIWAWGEQTHFTDQWLFEYGRLIAAIHFVLWAAYFYGAMKTLFLQKPNAEPEFNFKT